MCMCMLQDIAGWRVLTMRKRSFTGPQAYFMNKKYLGKTKEK